MEKLYSCKTFKWDLSKLLFWFNIVLIILTFARLLLSLALPVQIFSDEVYDENMLYQSAENLKAFNWLGGYSKLTLAKGVSYPLFIAICNWLRIPYTLGLGLLNVGSALVFVSALRKRFTNTFALGAIYLLLLYAPMTYSNLIGLRSHRMAIVGFLVLVVFGCIIGLYFRKEESIKTMLPWSLAAGLSLGFFWFIREDSMWILPFIAVVLIVMAVCILREKTTLLQKVGKLIVTALPPLMLVGAILLVSLFNYMAYGVFVTNDRTSGEFGKTMGYLYSIKDDNAPSGVWVSYDALQQAMEVSPTLASIEPQIYQSYQAWGGSVAPIRGDIVTWTLRDAVEMAGYFKDAVSFQNFFAQVNQELEQGFESGTLQKDDKFYFSSSSEGIEWAEMPEYISRTILDLGRISLYRDTTVSLPYSTGLVNRLSTSPTFVEDTKSIEALMNTQALYPTLYQLTLSGSLNIADGGTPSMEILDSNGNVLRTVSFSTFEESSYNFMLELDNLTINQLQLRILSDDTEIAVVPLESIETQQYQLSVEADWSAVNDAKLEQVAQTLKIPRAIDSIYDTLAFAVDILALCGYLLEIVFIVWLFKKKKVVWLEIERWLVVTGLALSAFVLTFGVEYFCSWLNQDGQIAFYACGAYTLVMLVKYLSIYLGISACCKWWKSRHTLSKTALFKQ